MELATTLAVLLIAYLFFDTWLDYRKNNKNKRE